MRQTTRTIALGLVGVAALACRHATPEATEAAVGIQGIQIATDAYLAYQHADCETVYRLTQPDQIETLEATELRHSLRLVRGYCQELDGDQPTARDTYRDLIREAPASFAAEDARERLRVLDRLTEEEGFAARIERAARGVTRNAASREVALRSQALYPPLARASGVEGFAVVDFGISPGGETIDPVIVDSDPPFLFEGTSLRAVRGWEYKSKRSADPSERHVIRIVFRSATEPDVVEEPGPQARSAEPNEGMN